MTDSGNTDEYVNKAESNARDRNHAPIPRNLTRRRSMPTWMMYILLALGSAVLAGAIFALVFFCNSDGQSKYADSFAEAESTEVLSDKQQTNEVTLSFSINSNSELDKTRYENAFDSWLSKMHFISIDSKCYMVNGNQVETDGYMAELTGNDLNALLDILEDFARDKSQNEELIDKDNDTDWHSLIGDIRSYADSISDSCEIIFYIYNRTLVAVHVGINGNGIDIRFNGGDDNKIISVVDNSGAELFRMEGNILLELVD